MSHRLFKSLERLGLQRRIMVYVATGLIVFSGVFIFIALQAIQQSTELAFRERLLIARTVAHEIDDDLEHFQQEVQDASVLVASAVARNTLPRINSSLRSLCNHWTPIDGASSLCELWVTDPNGQVVWTDESDRAIPARDLSQLPDLQSAFSSRRLTMADVHLPDGSGRPAIAFVSPLLRDSAVIGFLVGEIDRARLKSRMYPSLQIVQGDYSVEIIDNQGWIVATSEPGTWPSQSSHVALVASMWQDGHAGIRHHTMTANGTERGHVVAFAPLERIRWGVVLEQEDDEALALPRQLQNQFIGWVALALGGALVLAWVTTSTVVRPIRRLISATDEIANGSLDHPLTVGRDDELGILTRRFERMRIALRESLAEIAGWNRELETRVQERTRELKALSESSYVLTQTLDLEILCEIVMKETRHLLPSVDAAALLLTQPGTGDLVIRATVGLECVGMSVPKDKLVSHGIWMSPTPVRLTTPEQIGDAIAVFSGEDRVRLQQALASQSSSGAAGLPLRSKGEYLGMLMLFERSPQTAFDDHTIALLQALANQAATSITNAYLYQQASEVGALRELNRLKSEFVTRASHELRTPMTAIKSLTESLQRPDLPLDPPTRREFLEGIDSAADRLDAIVNDLIALARVESGQLGIHHELVDTGAVVTGVAEEVRAQMPDRSIFMQVDPGLPPVLGDRERLEDVLRNLLSNALKYSEPGSTVRLEAERHDGRVIIAVADQGIGIPPEERGRIFERFYRVDNAVTRRVGGAGLGLHICKTYVEAMGGTIAVDDNGVHGSIFRITLLAETEQD